METVGAVAHATDSDDAQILVEPTIEHDSALDNIADSGGFGLAVDQEDETAMVIEAETEIETGSEQKDRTMTRKSRTTLPIWYDHKHRWHEVLDASAPVDDSPGGRKEDRLSALLEWVEHRLELNGDTGSDLESNGNPRSDLDIATILAQQAQAIAALSAKVSGDNPELTDHIERLESDNQQLALERDQALSVLEQVRWRNATPKEYRFSPNTIPISTCSISMERLAFPQSPTTSLPWRVCRRSTQ